jgi:hypothetical protein
MRRFIGDPLADRCVIAVSRVGAAGRGIRITDDPDRELRYKSDDEALEFGDCDGEPWRRRQVIRENRSRGGAAS